MRGEMETIRVLHVDDDEAFTDLTADILEREGDRFTVESVYGVGQALEELGDTAFDCIVSDYDMPGQNGIDFLEVVREKYPHLPFILFTGKGSEEIASEAISAGVTDYLQKEPGTERYELLANRIETAVGQYRAERELERQNDLFGRAQAIANVGAWEYDVETDSSYVTSQTKQIHGLTPEEGLSAEKSLEYYHPEDRSTVCESFNRAIEDGEPYDLEVRLITEDGNECWVRTRGEPQIEQGEVVRVRGTIQEITEQKRRERELERQNDRLEEFAHVISHDIRSPLQVAKGQLDIAKREGSEEAFRQVEEAHDRIEALIKKVLTLARQGREITETRSIDIADVAREAWKTVNTSNTSLRTTGKYEVEADPDRLRQLFENLFRNAIEHSNGDVTISVGPLEPFPTSTRVQEEFSPGFYVADDGPGIPESEQEKVFEAGYSTSDSGTGFGLTIVKRVVEAHNWDIEVTEGVNGGARFEITESPVPRP